MRLFPLNNPYSFRLIPLISGVNTYKETGFFKVSSEQKKSEEVLMKISTKGRYALRVMVDLARHNTGDWIRLKDIAVRQGISEKYLEAIVKTLVVNNLLEGKRGKNGGYRLLKEPAAYTVWDIISVTETGELAPVACLEEGAEDCPKRDTCPTIAMWRDFGNVERDYFSKITIQDLVNRAAAAAENDTSGESADLFLSQLSAGL